MGENEELAEGEVAQAAPPVLEIENAANENRHNIDDNLDPGKDGHVSPEQTRSTVALLFIIGFFSILFLCFVYAIVTGASISEVKDILVAIIGALSGTLGFIVGYYYKSESK